MSDDVKAIELRVTRIHGVIRDVYFPRDGFFCENMGMRDGEMRAFESFVLYDDHARIVAAKDAEIAALMQRAEAAEAKIKDVILRAADVDAERISAGRQHVIDIRRLEDYLAAAEAERDAARKGLDAVEALMAESTGVVGLHLNGDVATWESLRTGGQFEGWLLDFDAALATEGGTPDA